MRNKRIQSLLASICARAAVCAFSIWLVMSPCAVMAYINWAPNQPATNPYWEWIGTNGRSSITIVNGNGDNPWHTATGTIIAGVGGGDTGTVPNTAPTDTNWTYNGSGGVLTLNGNTSGDLRVANTFGISNGGSITINGGATLDVVRYGANATARFATLNFGSGFTLNNSGDLNLTLDAASGVGAQAQNLYNVVFSNATFNNNTNASVTRAGSWTFNSSGLNNTDGSITGATDWMFTGSRLTNIDGTLTVAPNEGTTVTGRRAWYFVSSTLDNVTESDSDGRIANINLGLNGRMFLIGSTFNAISNDTTDFNGGSVGAQTGRGLLTEINGDLTRGSAEVVFSGGIGSISPSWGGDYPATYPTRGGGNIVGNLGVTNFRYFNARGETGGTANLRFAHLEQLQTVPYRTGLVAASVYLDRARDNQTIINTDRNARIYNPQLFLDGTFGRDAYWLQQNNLIPIQNQSDMTRRNDNNLYNIVRVRGEGVGLGITSNITLAKINPEFVPRVVDASLQIPLQMQTEAIIPTLVYTAYDRSYDLHNPNSVFYYNKPTVTITNANLVNFHTITVNGFVYDRSYWGQTALILGQTVKDVQNPYTQGNPYYLSGEYNAAWDPTNNPLSTLYKVAGGKYDPFYDPSAAVHNGSRVLADGYNPKFDRSSPNYNTASWYGDGTRVPPDYLVNPHIAYNPYLDTTGYSGGWTKVDTGMLWIQTSPLFLAPVLDDLGNPTGATHLTQMNRDINSLIDVQGGMLRFNRQEDLRPVWLTGDTAATNPYAPGQRWNINPNGYIAAGQVAADKSNYYTIQLNTLSNPNTTTDRNATVLSTSRGQYYSGDTRLKINNRIILHGGGGFEVGFQTGGQAGSPYWVSDVKGEYAEDDSMFRNYQVFSAADSAANTQGGGLGYWMGYLWLNNATLVGQRPTENTAPFLNKTGVGVLDLTGVNWEYEQGLTNVELNVTQGTLAFTNQPDLGSGRIALQGRDAMLAILKDSELDRGSIKYNPLAPLNRDLVSGYDTGWTGVVGTPSTGEILNPKAGSTEINNIIVLAPSAVGDGGGTINVVQGGLPPAVGSLIFPQPFYSEYDITKTRAGDGYENQHNFIVRGNRIQGSGALRKIGLGMLTIEGDYRVEARRLDFPVRTGQTERSYENVQFELQRGTLRFSSETNLGGNPAVPGAAGAGGTILFTLDKNATLQYYGKDQEMVVRNAITMTYDRGLYNSGGATIDIRNSQSETLMTTLRLTGQITGDSNFLTITKLGQLKSVLDMTQARMVGTAGAAKWDVRTGELAFDTPINIGGGDITLSEATTLHKVYTQPTGTPPVSPNMQNVTIANNVLVRNNATIKVDGDATKVGGLLARLTLGGDLSVQTQLDKMGDGVLILDGSLASAGAADVGNIINGGLRIKEGKLEFSREQQLETLAGTAISINLYGSKAGLIYAGVGDVDPATRTPRPLTIDNNINILPLYHDLTNSPRIANITVTDATGNLGLTGEQLRGGDLVLNDLQRDADGNPVIGNDGKWATTSTPITGASTIVKDGLGTLTLSGVLNTLADNESISLLIKQGKIAFSAQDNLGVNAITFNGVAAKLEYLGTTTGADTATIANQLVFLNGGGTLSVLDAKDTLELKDGKIASNRSLAAIGENASYTGTTWTLAKEGAGKLDITDVDFTAAISPAGAAVEHLTNLAIKEGTVVFDKLTNLSGGSNKPLAITMGAVVPGVTIPGVVTTYTTYTSGILEYTGIADATFANNITLAGGKVVSPSTGLPIYDQLTGRQVVAGGGINVTDVATNLTWTGSISGTGSFVKSGLGTLTLGNANSALTGDVIVERGTLVLNTQQQFRGDIIVKNYYNNDPLSGPIGYEGNTLVAGAGNVISNKNHLYLASGTTFDMTVLGANNTATSQTLTGVMTLPIAGAGPSRILISADCTPPNPDPNVPGPNLAVGNTLHLDLDAGTTWRVGQIVGNTNSTLVIAKGYILVDDMSHFHGKQQSTGGTIINGGSTEAGTSHTITNSNRDAAEWISCNVTVSNGHITVGHNPNLSGGGFWASCNVTARNNSTIDVATDWVTSAGVSSEHWPDHIRTPNVVLENNSRISVQGNWQESGDISLDNSDLFIGGEWQHYNTAVANPWVAGLYDARYANATNPGYNYNATVWTQNQNGNFANGDIYWNQNTGTISNFTAIDKDLVYRSVTAKSGSTILLSGNGTSGTLSIDGSTLTVGHRTPDVDGNLTILAIDTGNYTVIRANGVGADATFTNNSTGTILGNWKSGNLTLSGGSDLTVGHTTIGFGGARSLTANTGDLEIIADPSGNRYISVGAGSYLNVCGNMTSGSVSALGDVFVGVWNAVIPGPAALPVSHGNATIDGTLFVSGTFRNAGTLAVKVAKDKDGKDIADTGNLVSNGGRLTVGSNLEVEAAVALIGGSQINVAKDWTTGEVLLSRSIVYVGNNLKTNGAAFEAHDTSTINVVEGWSTGNTWLNETTTTVGGAFDATTLIVQGAVSGSNDNLKVGNSLKVGTTDASNVFTGGRVTIAADPTAGGKATSINVGQNWTSGQIVTTGRNVDVKVGGNMVTGSISSDGGRFTVLKSFTAGDGTVATPGAITTSGVTWDVAGDWVSDSVTVATASTFDVGGHFDTRGNDVKFVGVQTATIGVPGAAIRSNWTSGQLSLTGGNSNLTVTGNLTSKAITSDGGSFIVGGNVDTGITKVTTRGANWDVVGNWTSGDIDIRNAGYFRTGKWDNADSTAKFIDVESIQINGDWNSKALTLSNLGNATSPIEVKMDVAGNFSPGATLTFDMPKGRSPLASDPIYRITADSVTLTDTTIAVGNAVNLTALGKYYAAQISTKSAAPLPTPGEITVADISLFKRVIVEQPTMSVLDIYVNATGFSGYVERLSEFNISGITHNQLEVIKNMTRVEQQITSFETAAATDRVNRLQASASVLNEPAMQSSLRSNAVVTEILGKLIEYGDNNSISVAERADYIGRALNELTGDTHANALLIASTRPWMEAYDRLRMDNEMYFVGDNYVASSQTMRGQSARLARMNRLWITPSYTFDSISSDGNARAASLGRTGFKLGLDRRIRHNATAGIMFNYDSARLRQDDDRVEGNDFGIGLYAGAMLGYYFELRGMLGCGWQNYESTRVLDLTPTGDNRMNASGRADGHNFSGSVELARPLFFGIFIFKPTLGLDVTSYARNAFDETGDAIAIRVGRTNYTRVSPRIGATWEAGTMNRFAVTTRFFVGYNLADDYITAQTQLVGISNHTTQEIRSVALGRTFIDAGIGGRYYMNRTRSMSAHGNFDLISSKRSFAGAVSGGMSWLY